MYAGCPSFSGLIDNGCWAVADGNGRVLGSCNLDQPFIPASILKIPTALVALDVLGRTYRFKTELYLDQKNNLYIRGGGDPMLITEEVELIVGRLCGMGIVQLADIHVDDSAFALELDVPGRGKSDNPYDAPLGAAAVNFNSVGFRVDNQHRVRSDEEHTPTLRTMRELGRGRKPGRYRVNICPGGCVDGRKRSAAFTGELFIALAEQAGIHITGSFARRRVSGTARLLFIHENSRTVEEVIASMLTYSNNFMANLLFLAVGREVYGYPATWDKARRAVRDRLAELVGRDVVKPVVQLDGAGLSRANRMTAGAMLRILHSFVPWQSLMPSRGQVLVKSGTMKGVSNYAGYLPGGKPFVIMLNQQANTRDRVLNRLRKNQFPRISASRRES